MTPKAQRYTRDELLKMLEHLRYETGQIVNFVRFQNQWCEVLHPELCAFTQRSIVEAGLIHLRCVIEFLHAKPVETQVAAIDYLDGWDWKISDNLRRYEDLSSRVAHLGIKRASTKDPWQEWLEESVPPVLRGFRDFLVRLEADDEEFYAIFVTSPTDFVLDANLLDQLLSLESP